MCGFFLGFMCGSWILFQLSQCARAYCDLRELIEQLPEATAIVCDKGYDSQGIRDQITAKGAVPVIPRRKNSKVGNADLDKSLYKLRHLVENAFCNLKKFRAIATRLP